MNGVTIVTGLSIYNKIFYGFTPGAGIEIRFGRHKKPGFDFGLNVPIHGEDFNNQVTRMKNDPRVSGVTSMPVAFSLGYHYEF